MSCWTDSIGGIISCLVAGVIVKFLIDFVGWLLHLRSLKSPVAIREKASWALVTGCTDGIGEAYAHQLARLGFNLILVSRTESKLVKVAQEIQSRHKNVATEILPFDFSSKSAPWPALLELAGKHPVGILVNNVGINVDCPTMFVDTPEAKIDDIITVNIGAMTRLTHAVLPAMLQRRSGAVINLSSFTGRIPTPMLAVYSATKAYADFFSHALHAEVAPQGVVVQSVVPGFVQSSMSGMRAGGMVATAALVARQSLERLGQTRTAPFWIHALMEKVMRTVPYSIISRVILGQNKTTRVRWERKQARSN